MAAGEDDALAVGGEEAVGGAAAAGADEFGLAASLTRRAGMVAGRRLLARIWGLGDLDPSHPGGRRARKLQRVNLVEHVLARDGLEDDRATVSGEVAFPGFG